MLWLSSPRLSKSKDLTLRNHHLAVAELRLAPKNCVLQLRTILGFGPIRVALIHPGEQPIQRGDPREQLLVFGALKTATPDRPCATRSERG